MPASGGTGTEERERWSTVEELCDRYLGGRPSEAALQVLKNAEQQRPEVRNFVERAFRLMALSKFDPRDFSPFVARFFTVIAPGILPGAWGGIVPPFTLPGRHRKIDAYLRSNEWAQFEPGTVLLDVGCGFPPQTSIEAAEAFPEWRIVGPRLKNIIASRTEGCCISIPPLTTNKDITRKHAPPGRCCGFGNF